METSIEQISYADVEHFLTGMRSEIEQTISKTPLKNQATLQKLERRSQNVLSAINMIQAEAEFYERGICCVCGSLGDGISWGKTYCGLHGSELY